MEKTDLRNVLATRLKMAREMSGLSQAQVAEALGLHRPSVSEIEAGNRKVSSEELRRFAKIYKVRVSWLLAENESDPASVGDPRFQLVARELQKLKPEDKKKLFNLLSAMQAPGDTE